MATSQIGNPFEQGAAVALENKERQRELVEQKQTNETEEPKKPRRTRKPKSPQVVKQDTEKTEQSMDKEKTSPFTGPLVTANFKIPSDARKRLKVYAAMHDMTSVQVLLEMISKLPG